MPAYPHTRKSPMRKGRMTLLKDLNTKITESNTCSDFGDASSLRTLVVHFTYNPVAAAYLCLKQFG